MGTAVGKPLPAAVEDVELVEWDEVVGMSAEEAAPGLDRSRVTLQHRLGARAQAALQLGKEILTHRGSNPALRPYLPPHPLNLRGRAIVQTAPQTNYAWTQTCLR